MFIVIRISGEVNMRQTVEETLFRMRLRRKYSASLYQETIENQKLIDSVKDHVAYGIIDKETLKELIEKRGKLIDKSKKLDASKIIETLSKKSIKDSGIKPFFRLHPPIGGIDSKKHFGISKKAVLGNHKEKINELVRRML